MKPPDFFIRCAAPGNGCSVEAPDAVGGDTSKKTAVQCRVQKADAIQFTINGIAKPSNVDTNSRILCYDIRELGKQLLPVGMQVVLESVFNRIIHNRKMGPRAVARAAPLMPMFRGYMNIWSRAMLETAPRIMAVMASFGRPSLRTMLPRRKLKS